MSTFKPQTADLVEAILSNSATLVKKYLNAGVDANANPFRSIPLLQNVKNEDGEVYSDALVAFDPSLDGSLPSPLHLAVVNCYHCARKDRTNAQEIVRILLKHGADPSAITTKLVLTNIQGYEWRYFDSSNKTPSGLALFLKRHPRSIYEKETESMLDQVIEILEKATQATSQPHTTILKSTAELYEKLFLNQDCSDVTFACNDGVEVPAHRCILMAASDYFKNAFQGPWSESDGKWTTAHSSKVMTAILAFIYQGHVRDDLKQLEPLELFSVAAEYNIPSLQAMAENRCIQSLNCDNVKSILQEGHLHRNEKLKEACFAFVRSNAAHVLTNPSMMNLATEDAGLWSELSQAIAPAPKKKRARVS